MPPKERTKPATSKRLRWTGFAQRHPTKSTCRTCRASTLTGIYNGFDIHINPTPLTPIGELDQLIRGHATYVLSDDNFDQRTASYIRRGLPWFGDLVTEHRCGEHIRPEHIKHRPPTKPWRTPGQQPDLFDTTEYADDEPCPF